MNVPTRTKTIVNLDDVRPGDVIFLYAKDNAQPYLVVDTGKPFILIENMKTHFASLYRVTDVIYKEI